MELILSACLGRLLSGSGLGAGKGVPRVPFRRVLKGVYKGLGAEVPLQGFRVLGFYGFRVFRA